jgi:hypothetical protein
MNAQNWPKLVIGIRIATLADIPWMLDLAKECYPERGVERGVPWIVDCISSPRRLVLVGQNSMGVCAITPEYGFELRACVTMLAARRVKTAPLEALRMLRVMLQWARERGAQGSLRLEADTGVDFEAFARRLGGSKKTTSFYAIPL